MPCRRWVRLSQSMTCESWNCVVVSTALCAKRSPHMLTLLRPLQETPVTLILTVVVGPIRWPRGLKMSWKDAVLKRHLNEEGQRTLLSVVRCPNKLELCITFNHRISMSMLCHAFLIRLLACVASLVIKPIVGSRYCAFEDCTFNGSNGAIEILCFRHQSFARVVLPALAQVRGWTSCV